MSTRQRRKHSSQQKAALLKRHHVEKVPVSTVSDENKLQPSVFYTWQRQLFENASVAFDGGKQGGSSREKELEARVAQLAAKLAPSLPWRASLLGSFPSRSPERPVFAGAEINPSHRPINTSSQTDGRNRPLMFD